MPARAGRLGSPVRRDSHLMKRRATVRRQIRKRRPCITEGKVGRMPSDPPEKPKPDEEARVREKSNEREKKDELQPSREKIPEGEGNLRRRADWFQKRTGGAE